MRKVPDALAPAPSRVDGATEGVISMRTDTHGMEGVTANRVTPVLYLVECYWPGATYAAVSEAVDHARAAAVEIAATGRQVRLIRAMFFREDEAVLIVFEAPCPGAVRQATEQAGFSADRISVAEDVA